MATQNQSATGADGPIAPASIASTLIKSWSGVTWAGLVIIYVSVAAFLFVGYLLYKGEARTDLSAYTPELIVCAVGVFTALLGVKLVRAGGVTPSDPLPVVNATEWGILSRAISLHPDDPIGQYIRLSSLTGVTGLFTKLGLSGLPLATIGLTILFAIMSVAVPTENAQDRFYELTQLTLGAFIGSFVQRQVAALRDAAALKPEPNPNPNVDKTVQQPNAGNPAEPTENVDAKADAAAPGAQAPVTKT